MALFYFLNILLVAGAFGIFIYFYLRELVRSRKRDLTVSALLLIRIPRAEGGVDNSKLERKKFEDFLKRLASFHRECSLEMSIEHVGEDMHFHVSVPRAFVGSVREEVYLLWRGASVDPAQNDPGIFRSHGISIGGYIAQKKDHVFSVKTHRVLEADPFASMLDAFSRVGKIGEGAGMQIVLRPVSLRHKKSIARSLSSIMRGELGETVARNKLISAEGISVPSVGAEIEERKKREKIKKDIFNFARNKLSGPIFEANVRVCVSAGAKFRAEEILDEIAASFSHFDDPYHNQFKFVKPRNPEKLVEHFVARRFSDAEVVVLSSEEIASFYHFPAYAEKRFTGIRWLRSKQIPAPLGLSHKGICIGENEFHGGKTQIFMGEKDRNRHLYIVGEKHSGKSTLMGNMIIQDIEQGHGVALVDPTGKLSQAMLTRIPRGRARDVVYLDMADALRLPGIDVLRHGAGTAEGKIRMAHDVSNIVNKFFTLETMGLMFDKYMRNAILLLSEGASGSANILDVPRVLVEKKYRAMLLSKSKNSGLLRFWEHEARSSRGEAALQHIAPFVLSRFEKFASSDYLRSIFQDPASAVDIESAIEKGKIILINLGEDKLGRSNSRFLGMLIANKLLAAARSDVRTISREKKNSFNVYLDDFGGYVPDSAAKTMSESENRHMYLSLATRSVGDLPLKTREAIFKNPVSKIAFRVNQEDAEILAPEFEPAFSKYDLMNANNLVAHAKIAVRGELSAPFNIKIRTDSWSIGNVKLARDIKEHSRAEYGRDIRELEKKNRYERS